MPSGTPYDKIFQWTKILSSSIATDDETGDNEGVLYNVGGVLKVDWTVDGPDSMLSEDEAEGDSQAEVFGQLGFLARPLPPGTGADSKRYAEALCLRSGDSLLPVAYRDTRLRMQGNGPAEGTVAMIGYGGGFLSMSPVTTTT